MERLTLTTISFVAVANVIAMGGRQDSTTAVVPAIPKTWDDAALADFELPLAVPRYSPVHVSSNYYYQMPVRPVYRSYPVYAPGKEPTGYLDWLAQQEPEIVFDPASLKTEAEWIRAGELVFDAPITYTPLANASSREPPLLREDGHASRSGRDDAVPAICD